MQKDIIENKSFIKWRELVSSLVTNKTKLSPYDYFYIACTGLNSINQDDDISDFSFSKLNYIFNAALKLKNINIIFESSLYLVSSFKSLEEAHSLNLLNASIELNKEIPHFIIQFLLDNRKKFKITLCYKLLDYFINFSFESETYYLINLMRLEHPKMLGPVVRTLKHKENYSEGDQLFLSFLLNDDYKLEFMDIFEREKVSVERKLILKDKYSESVKNNSISNKDLASIFNYIYTKKIWGRNNDLNIPYYSGDGTYSKQANKILRELLDDFKKKFKVESVLDYGCGDFNIGKMIHKSFKSYIGVDISDVIIDYNKLNNKLPNVSFYTLDEFDLNRKPLPELILIRQVLQHLPNFQIKKISNWIEKNFKYCITLERAPKEVSKSNLEGKSFAYDRVYNESIVRIHEDPINIKGSIIDSKKIFDEETDCNYELFLYSFKN